MGDYYPNRPYPGPNPNPKKLRPGPRIPQYVPKQEDGRLPTYKEFVLHLSNDITEAEAQAKWKECQNKFYKNKIQIFFEAHHQEEWFREKYLTTEVNRLKEATKEVKIQRKAAYEQLLQKYNPDDLTISYDNRESLSKFLDNFSFLLEGATMEEIENNEAVDKYSVSSVYTSTLHLSIDRAQLEEIAASKPGFLRLALSDVQTENWKRKAWVTYKRMDNVSIKNLCWDFNAHKINDHETKFLINFEKERLRQAHMMFNHVSVVRSDFKNLARILTYYEGEDCPLLESIKDYLIDETNEEAKLSGSDAQTTDDAQPSDDRKYFQTLDKILLYLRVVHSFDYYALTEFTDEHNMPRRVGVMFLRPAKPPNYENDISKKDLDEFIKQQQFRTNLFIEKPLLSEAEQKQIGWKDPDEAVEHFIIQNTEERIPNEKYLCKLSRKKFIAAKYVRAHIFNRLPHMLEPVRAHAEFFNNYVADPRRPM